MPIDTSIYRILQPPERKDPFTALSQMANAQTAIHTLKTAQQQQADQAAIRQVFAETGGDTDAALKRLRTVNPAAAFEFETQIAGQQKAARDAQRAEVELQQKQLETGLRTLHSVRDTRTLQIAKRRIRAIDPEVADLLPETYDDDESKAAVDNVIRLSLSAKDALAGGEGFTLSAGQTRYGPKGEVVAAADDTTFTLGPGQTRFGPGGAVVASVPAGPRDERLVQIIGPNGQPIWVRESQAVGKPAGAAPGEAGAVKLSAAQQEDVATMLTVQQLGQDAVRLGDEIGWAGVGPIQGRFGASLRGSGGEKGETLRNLIGNIQGTIAKLRGGASFTPSEQAMLDRYTPTATDSDQTIKTKIKSLADFIEKKRANTLRVAAGQYEPPPPPGKKKIGRFEVEER